MGAANAPPAREKAVAANLRHVLVNLEATLVAWRSSRKEDEEMRGSCSSSATAVVMQSIAANIARFEAHTPIGTTLEERLESVAVTVLRWILVSDSIRLMRIAIAEASRFLNLASSVYGMGRERGARAVARLLAEVAHSDELGTLPALAPARVATTTRFFQDLVLFPLILRTLFGETLKQLCAEIGPHVERSVAFFLAACRHGGVT